MLGQNSGKIVDTITDCDCVVCCLQSRTAPNAKPYSAAAAVLLNEILKGSISFAIALNNIEYQPKRSVSTSTGGAVVAEKLALSSEAAAGGAASHVHHHHANGGLAAHGKRLSLSVGRNREMSIGSEESWKRKLNPSSAAHSPSLYANKSWWTDLEQWRYRTVKLATACFRCVHTPTRTSWCKKCWADPMFSIDSPDCWKLAVPACCYVLQNNVSSHLNAVSAVQTCR